MNSAEQVGVVGCFDKHSPCDAIARFGRERIADEEGGHCSYAAPDSDDTIPIGDDSDEDRSGADIGIFTQNICQIEPPNFPFSLCSQSVCLGRSDEKATKTWSLIS